MKPNLWKMIVNNNEITPVPGDKWVKHNKVYERVAHRSHRSLNEIEDNLRNH